MDADRQVDRTGGLISRSVESGLFMNTCWNGFIQFRYSDDNIRSGDRLIGRRQVGYFTQFSPSRLISTISLSGVTGQEIDFANSRPGTGTTMRVSAVLNPTNHLNLLMNADQRWLNVEDAIGVKGRLFTARVARLRATYTLTSRLFVRVTAQYESTRRDPALYTFPVPAKQGAFSGQALLSYKLNWQSVMFVGYGDDRVRSDQDRLEKVSRQFFVRLSYAVQH